MKQQRHNSHTLINTTLDENGSTDKYKEFSDSDFSNEFEKLEDVGNGYEIHASQQSENVFKEENMKGTRVASYIDELSSGFDAKVQNDYEAGQGQKGQIGKGHEEEVAPSNNWENDKRNVVGRAAAANAIRRTAARLLKQADMLEGKVAEVEDDDDLGTPDEFEDIGCDDEVPMGAEASAEGTQKQATHPIEHNDKKDDPEADMPSDTGDEWIDIGPGEFDDDRDDIGRAGDNDKK
jgi:hypothetical protein